MGVVEFLTPLLNYIPLVSFIGAFIGGDQLLILLGVLAGKGTVSFFQVLLFFTLGTVASDIVWFLVGKSSLIQKLRTSRLATHRRAMKIRTHLRNIIKNRFFRFLLISKFTYGTRIASVIYLGHKISFRKFFWYDIASCSIIVSLMLSISWLYGKGLWTLTSNINNVNTLLGILVTSSIALYLVIRFILTRIFKQ